MVVHLLPLSAVWIIWNWSRIIQLHPKSGEEVPREGVTVGQGEGPRVEHHLLVDVEMEHLVVLVIIWRREGNAMAINECACNATNAEELMLFQRIIEAVSFQI